MENDIFALKQGQDLENQAAHPHQEFQGVPPPHPRTKNLSVSKFAHMIKYKLLGQNCAEIYLRYPQLSFLIAKNSTTKLLLSNSLKGKSRHDQFFQQNKS